MKNVKSFTPEQRWILMQMGIQPDSEANRMDIPVQPGMEAPRRSVEQNVELFHNLRAANPVVSPVAAGTPTLAKLGLIEETRRFDEQKEFNRLQHLENIRQFDEQARLNMIKHRQNLGQSGRRLSLDELRHEEDIRQFEERLKLDRDEFGLRRDAARVATPTIELPTRADAMTSIKTLVDESIKTGQGWHMVESRLIANAGAFHEDTMPLDEAIRLAFQHYKHSAFTPTGERRPRGFTGPLPAEDLTQIYQRWFPKEFESGLLPFNVPPAPPPASRVWWQPWTWGR